VHGSPLVGWLLVALCGTAGGYCLLGMRRGPAAGRCGAGGEALMGLGMAAMAVPATAGPQPWAPPLYAAVFALSGLWGLRGLWHLRGAWAAGRGADHLHHAVGSSAMVYMALAMADGEASGHRAHAAVPQSGGVPLLTGLLLAYFTVYVLRTGVRLAPYPGPVPAAGPVPAGSAPPAAPARSPAAGLPCADRPELTAVCRVTMALGMLAMLLAL
jgi:hypothetical protein